MDKPHKQVVATAPVVIKFGQTRVHVADERPWHAFAEKIKCPNCEIEFIVTHGFPSVDFLAVLDANHRNKEEHPDYIASDPAFTSIADCDCGH